MHQYHYDKQGRVDHVEVIREPEWTQADRDKAEALLLYESQICPGCGNPVHEGHDPDAVFDVDTRVCMGCRALDIEQRNAQAKDQAAAKNAPPGTPQPSDGRRWVAFRRHDIEDQLRAEGKLPSQQKT